MKNKNIIYVFIAAFILQSCASAPKIAVDPSSIKDVTKYDKDLEECRAVSLAYDSSDAAGKSALLGGLGTVIGATAILATGGLYLLPGGVAIVGGAGAAAGKGVSDSKQNTAQEKIWASCMNDRGYKAYTSD
tara:strand:+ start:271 stop:666 length:396 start_codon:yes stop_codon:yes gene_type:complete